jgi:hypothetical protein
MQSLSRYLPSPFEEGSLLDENKAKLVLSIRRFFYQSVTLDFLESGGDIFVDNIAICGITDLGQLFPSTRLNDWNQFSTQAAINRIKLLGALFVLAPVSKKQAIMKYISTAMAYLIGCEISDEIEIIWREQITAGISQDADHDSKKVLAWITRILDAFVVYMGAFDSSSAFQDQVVVQSLCCGLREVLVDLQRAPYYDLPKSQDIQLADTIYHLNYYMNLKGDFQTEQEQVKAIV